MTSGKRSGFTLVELLVVIAIVITLAGFTIYGFNLSLSSDRVAGSSRQVQSFLEGARDRAIFAKAPRGVRFTIELDATGNYVARSMVYVSAPPPVYGLLRIAPDGRTIQQGLPVEPKTGRRWSELLREGLLYRGAKMQIGRTVHNPVNDPEDELQPNDLTFTFDDLSQVALGVDQTILTNVHPEWPMGTVGQLIPYKLSLAPAPMEGQKPSELGRNVVVDISKSKIPDAWRVNTNNVRTFDVMFSPRGMVTGPAASNGILHFVVRDQADLGNPLGSHRNEGAEAIVTIFTRTGAITTSPVFNEITDDNNGDGVPETWTDVDGDGVADGPADNPNATHSDPYYYAETGKEAAK